MQNKKNILLVDDDQRNIFALRLTLAARGYACICVQDAREAIATVQNHPDSIGMVLMDMMMPEMDGYEAIAVLKENKQTAGIPVVAVTAQAMTGDKERCMEAGADGYLPKPVDVDHLVLTIQKHFK